MAKRPASPRDVAEFERRVDSYFAVARRPSLGPEQSAAVLLAVSEDMLRMRTMTVPIEPGALMALSSAFDDSKYALKQALAAIGRWDSLGRGANDAEFRAAYSDAVKYLRLCDSYQGAVTAFSSYHDGRATAELSPSGKTLYLAPTDHDDAAYVRQLVDYACDQGIVPSDYLVRWVRVPETAPSVVRTIAARAVEESRRSIHYEWDASLSRKLCRELLFGGASIPDEWMYRGCRGTDIRAVMEAFRTVCLYHVLSVHFGAGLHGTPGMGLDSLVLEIARAELAHRLAVLSDVAESAVATILDLLTYGNGVRTPDPALQPLIPIDADRVAIPCFLVASSNVERNLLALQARKDKKEFDAQSDAFERRMIDELRPALASRIFRERYTIPGDREAGDVDLLLVSPEDKLMLVCELKWCIPPGETREVHNRMEAVESKAEQLKRKVAACVASRDRILNDLRVPPAAEWNVAGLVVLDGFSSGPRDGVTVVTVDVLMRALGGYRSLRAAHSALVGDVYHPTKGEHFRRTSLDLRFGELCVVWQGTEVLPKALELVRQARP